MNTYFTALQSYLCIYGVNAYQIRKMHTSWQLCKFCITIAYTLESFDGQIIWVTENENFNDHDNLGATFTKLKKKNHNFFNQKDATLLSAINVTMAAQ